MDSKEIEVLKDENLKLKEQLEKLTVKNTDLERSMQKYKQ